MKGIVANKKTAMKLIRKTSRPDFDEMAGFANKLQLTLETIPNILRHVHKEVGTMDVAKFNIDAKTIEDGIDGLYTLSFKPKRVNIGTMLSLLPKRLPDGRDREKLYPEVSKKLKEHRVYLMQVLNKP